VVDIEKSDNGHQGKKGKQLIKLTPEDYNKIDELAKRRGMKKTWLIMALVEKEEAAQKKKGMVYGRDFW
jgi:hypothetical protein